MTKRAVQPGRFRGRAEEGIQESILSRLARLKNLSGLSPRQLAELAAATSVVRYKKGQRIFSERQLPGELYVLLSGFARVSRFDAREPSLVMLFGPGDVFGIPSLFGRMLGGFRSDAFTDCIAGEIDPDKFARIVLGVSLEQTNTFLNMTMGRWLELVLRYTKQLGLNLRRRLAIVLLELGVQFGAEDSRGILLTLPITHRDLAALVGASRSKTTELLNDFDQRGLLGREGRRLILHPEKLREVAG